jgi:hypothetical protein
MVDQADVEGMKIGEVVAGRRLPLPSGQFAQHSLEERVGKSSGRPRRQATQGLGQQVPLLRQMIEKHREQAPGQGASPPDLFPPETLTKFVRDSPELFVERHDEPEGLIRGRLRLPERPEEDRVFMKMMPELSQVSPEGSARGLQNGAWRSHAGVRMKNGQETGQGVRQRIRAGRYF